MQTGITNPKLMKRLLGKTTQKCQSLDTKLTTIQKEYQSMFNAFLKLIDKVNHKIQNNQKNWNQNYDILHNKMNLVNEENIKHMKNFEYYLSKHTQVIDILNRKTHNKEKQLEQLHTQLKNLNNQHQKEKVKIWNSLSEVELICNKNQQKIQFILQKSKSLEIKSNQKEKQLNQIIKKQSQFKQVQFRANLFQKEFQGFKKQLENEYKQINEIINSLANDIRILKTSQGNVKQALNQLSQQFQSRKNQIRYENVKNSQQKYQKIMGYIKKSIEDMKKENNKQLQNIEENMNGVDKCLKQLIDSQLENDKKGKTLGKQIQKIKQSMEKTVTSLKQSKKQLMSIFLQKNIQIKNKIDLTNKNIIKVQLSYKQNQQILKVLLNLQKMIQQYSTQNEKQYKQVVHAIFEICNKVSMSNPLKYI